MGKKWEGTGEDARKEMNVLRRCDCLLLWVLRLANTSSLSAAISLLIEIWERRGEGNDILE